MPRLLLVGLLLVAHAAVAEAQPRFLPFGGKKTSKPVAAPVDNEYEQLARQAKAAEEQFELRLDQLRDEHARAELNKQRPDFAPQFERLAESRRHSPVGLKSLVWLCRFGHPVDTEQHIDLILRDYLDSEQLVDAMRATAPYAGRVPAARKLYRAALASSPHRDVRGLACYYLAYSCIPEPDFASIAPARESEATALLEQVIREYADVPSYRGPLGDLAAGGLNAIRHLKVGKQAPQIEGRDAKGQRLRLSDYRGQVVVVTFWADWCGPCLPAIPLQQALVEKFAERPFALLGVNGDPPEQLKTIMARHRINWRSWADGPAGPIAASWSVGMWPTTYVLDARGVIRYRNVPSDKLDQLVAGLLREMGPAGEQRAALR